MKVKIFSGTDKEIVAKEINEFLTKNKMIDIKFNAYVADNSWGVDCLVVYEEYTKFEITGEVMEVEK